MKPENSCLLLFVQKGRFFDKGSIDVKSVRTLEKKNLEKKILKSRCHTKRRASSFSSFGMTTTQDIRDLFA